MGWIFKICWMGSYIWTGKFRIFIPSLCELHQKTLLHRTLGTPIVLRGHVRRYPQFVSPICGHWGHPEDTLRTPWGHWGHLRTLSAVSVRRFCPQCPQGVLWVSSGCPQVLSSVSFMFCGQRRGSKSNIMYFLLGSRSPMNIRIKPSFDKESTTRGPVLSITLNYTFLFMKNYKSRQLDL